ncbi:MAG: DNA polymerase [Clostridiales bacterium]|nr:DNA polymerase [Clostridiales bacterium]
MSMRHLSIDIETKSGADISKTGSYQYARDADFDILLFAYQVDEQPVEVVDFTAGETLPEEIKCALSDPSVVKHAYNAAFEWYCLNTYGLTTPLDEWRCTMVHGLYCGYPAGLAAIGAAMGLPEDKRKLSVGKALIRHFCTPAAKGRRKWILPQQDPDKWALFKEYCRQDVVTEHTILQRLSLYPVPEAEWEQWRMDVSMNAYGARVDRDLIWGALEVNLVSMGKLTEETAAITGLANPNSTAQLLPWLADRGTALPNLQKLTVEDALKDDLPSDVRRVLEIRQQLGKTSVKKYDAMAAAIGNGDRVRGLTQFYGANRTGRWAGRLVQIQNLPRNYMPDLDDARRLVKQHKYDGIRMIYGNVPDTLSQLIRTAFIPSEGRRFVVADFSAIEARVIAWLAGETWVSDVFKNGGDIYCETASAMFGVPVVKHGVNGDLRQKGKIATLALGYQGGTSALVAMGALRMGIPEDDLPDIVDKWRATHPCTVHMWYEIGQAAIDCIETCENQTATKRGLIFRIESDMLYGQSFLTVQLPSGRKLFYPRPFLKENQFGRPAMHYYGVEQGTKKWGVESTYGGKLTENIVQAIARDCLAVVLARIHAEGWDYVFHVHDEVIVDAKPGVTVDDLCRLMAEPIPWAPGLILKGAGFESSYYMKD